MDSRSPFSPVIMFDGKPYVEGIMVWGIDLEKRQDMSWPALNGRH